MFILQRLPTRTEDGFNPRQQFINELGVTSWTTPRGRKYAPVEHHDPDAPAWWQGDEEASQSFLAATGVKL